MSAAASFWRAAYRVLIRTLPSWFAERNASDLRATFEEMLAEQRGVARQRRAARECLDILATSLRLRVRPPVSRHAFNAADGAMHRASPFTSAVAEARQGLRALRRAPAFSLSALATLSLGIGAVAAIFNLAYGLWLKPLPYADPLTLATIRDSNQGLGANVSAPELADYAQVPSFSEIAGYHYGAVVATIGGEPTRLVAYNIEPQTFSVLGIKPSLGRGFMPEDFKADARPVILSDRIWRRMFNGDPHIIGKTMDVRGSSIRIIGVMPHRFEFPLDLKSDVWLPMDAHQSWLDRDTRLINAVARLRPGRTTAQAQSEIAVISARLASAFPASNKGWSARVGSLVEQTVGHYQTTFIVLLTMVGLLLCIACANIASLFVARHMIRRSELVVRTALGATTWRIRRMVMTESLLLSLASGAIGIGVAYTLTSRITAMLPSYTPRRDSIEMNRHVLLFALGVSVLVGILCGLASASGDGEGARMLHSGRGVIGAGRNRLRGSLVIAEVAFSLVLVVAAGLMTKSFAGLMHAERGYEPHGLLTMQVSIPFDKYQGNSTAIAQSFQHALDAVRSVPGVQVVGRAAGAPGSSLGTLCCGPVRTTPADGARTVGAIVRGADPTFFTVMQTPVIEGRAFTDQDRDGTPLVAMVSKSLAGKLFPHMSAVGRTVIVSDPGSGHPEGIPMEITGVVSDMHDGPTPSPDIYRPAAQVTLFWSDIVARTSGDPATLVTPVRAALRAADPDYLIENVTPMTQILADDLALEHTQSLLATLFGTLATILCAIGLYGLLANIVSQRVQEIGVRRALGAQNGDIFRGVMLRGVTLTAVGIAGGIAGALALHRVIGTKLFGLATIEPRVVLGAAALLMVISILASYIPARRAMRIDPLDAMR